MPDLYAATLTIANLDPRYGNGLGTTFQSARSVRVYARYSF